METAAPPDRGDLLWDIRNELWALRDEAQRQSNRFGEGNIDPEKLDRKQIAGLARRVREATMRTIFVRQYLDRLDGNNNVSLKKRIAAALKERPMMVSELEECIGASAHNIGTELHLLQRDGKVVVSGKRRSPGGRPSKVFSLPPPPTPPTNDEFAPEEGTC